MDQKFISNSLVIIANDHNPTLISDSFLIKSKIIEKPEEIDRNSVVLTPVFARLTIIDKADIELDPKRLAITSRSLSKHPFLIGQKYCKALEYIKGKAIGINFDLSISNYNFLDWFNQRNAFDKAKCVEAKYSYKNCNATVIYKNEDNAIVKFNFHYSLKPNSMLSEIKLDFKEEWKNNQSILNQFVLNTFKQ